MLPYPAEFASARLRYARVAPQDVTPKYVAWLADPKVNKYLETRFGPPSEDECQQFAADRMSAEDCYLLAIRLGERHIGNIKLSLINFTHGYADLSYFIGEKDCWGQGYATEAVTAVTGWAFNVLGLYRVEAGAQLSHGATRRVLSKAGFVRENPGALPKMLDPTTGDARREPQLIYAKVRP